MAFLFTFSTQVFAVDFTVNLTTDQHDASLADGICDVNLATAELECSLRAAVEQANNLGSNDRVLFNLPANSTITLTVANGGEIPITNNGTLEIIETATSNLRISGNNTSRVFFVNPGANLMINGVTITNGRTTVGSNGGGIRNNGTLTLTNSTVSGNTANLGGGINIFNGTLTLTNSTVSGNTAAGFGGGIFNREGTLNLTSVTVAFNSATNTGGGVYNEFGTANLSNTIVANNTAAAAPDFSGAILSTSSFNLIGNGQGTTDITNGTNSNQVGTSANPIDPKLAPLANNGGATQTHALLFGSPAIDQGNSFGLTTDQRGSARPVDNPSIINATGGNGADIGAFEVQLAPTAAQVTIGGRAITANGRGISNVIISLTDASGTVRTARTTAFGRYRFTNVQAGETYIITAKSKRFQFSQPTQVLNVNEDMDSVNFVAY